MAKLVKKLSLKQGDTREEFYFDATTGVKGYDLYSDEEIVVGKWTDGRPVYRKKYDGVATVTDGNTPLGPLPDGFDMAVKITGTMVYAKGQSSETHVHIPYLNAGLSGALPYTYQGKMVIYLKGSAFKNCPCTVYLDYVKSTDQPDSFEEEKVELTVEHKTGETYNGKDVYEITTEIDTSDMPKSAATFTKTYTLPGGITSDNVDLVDAITGVGYQRNYTYQYPLPEAWSGYAFFLVLTNTGLYFSKEKWEGAFDKIRIKLRYTKK